MKPKALGPGPPTPLRNMDNNYKKLGSKQASCCSLLTSCNLDLVTGSNQEGQHSDERQGNVILPKGPKGNAVAPEHELGLTLGQCRSRLTSTLQRCQQAAVWRLQL